MHHAEAPRRRAVRFLALVAAASLCAARAVRAGTITAGSYSLAVSSLTGTWSSTYPGGTQYTAILSTGMLPNGYSGNLSSTTLNLFAGFTGLAPATQFDVAVSTLNGQLVDLGATA